MMHEHGGGRRASWHAVRTVRLYRFVYANEMLDLFTITYHYQSAPFILYSLHVGFLNLFMYVGIPTI